MKINHPLLGPRNASEFTILGDAKLLQRPNTSERDQARVFYEYLYLRDNPIGQHQELWFHEQGDRSWLIVSRDTLTHEINNVELASKVIKKGQTQ
jgi:heterotetrameric sarcosine oxidase delta subunit